MGHKGYLYTLNCDCSFPTLVRGAQHDNEWMRLERNGRLLVKGSFRTGYAWDGCSPKWTLWDAVIGTPEGVLNPRTMVSKTYWPSLVHDVFYQFSADLRSSVRRRDVDRTFFAMLRREHFALARVYWLAVRLGGGPSWGIPDLGWTG